MWITDDMKLEYETTEACKKANRMLGLIRRTILHKDQPILVALYKSVVRPHLEYCCSAWSPRYVKDKECLEKVQHRFTWLFKDLRDLDYINRLDRLGLWALEKHRHRADLIEVFKLCKVHTLLLLDRFFQLDNDGRMRGDSLKIHKPCCHLSPRCQKIFLIWQGH